MPSSIYRTDYPDDCLVHDIDGLKLVYHRASGATHFLNSPAPEMLAVLADAPCNRETLAMRLCDRLDLPLDEEAQSVIDQRIDDLIASGLIRAA